MHWCATDSRYTDNDWGYCDCPKEWKKREATACQDSSIYQSFPSLRTAQDKCIGDENCRGISKKSCNDPTNKYRRYRLCNEEFKTYVIGGACVFEKPEIYRIQFGGNKPNQKDTHENVTDSTPADYPESTNTQSAIENEPFESLPWEHTLFFISIGICAVLIILSMRYAFSHGFTISKSILLALKVTFMFFCFLLAMNMTIKQILRYANNEDASVVSYKQFMGNHEYDYPTFTLCLANEPEIMYTDALEELHITGKEYTNVLKGQNSSHGAPNQDLGIIVDVDYDRFTIQLENVVVEAKFETEKENETLHFRKMFRKNDQLGTLETVLSKSYQEPGKLCFARTLQSENLYQSARTKDKLILDTSTLTKDFKLILHKNSGLLQIYIHYPGQFIRIKDKPIYEKALGELDENDVDVGLALSYISLLKKRPDANEKCNPELKDDDYQFKVQVIKLVGCIPIYWKSIYLAETPPYQICNQPDQLEHVYNLINNFHQVTSRYSPPCIEMMTPVNVQEKSMKTLGVAKPKITIHLTYATETFQEVLNSKDFNINSLWSNIGGFVGIFLGYSVLQIPEILGSIWILNWKKMKTFWRKTNFANLIGHYYSRKHVSKARGMIITKERGINKTNLKRMKTTKKLGHSRKTHNTLKCSKDIVRKGPKNEFSQTDRGQDTNAAKRFLENACDDALYILNAKNVTSRLIKLEEQVSKLQHMQLGK